MSFDDELRSIDQYRGYLLILARVQMDACLQGIIDASDVVQETLLKAHRSRDQFRGRTEGERAAWLRSILASTMIDTVRKFSRESDRRVRARELEQALGESSCRLEALLAADQSSPSERFDHHEQIMRLSETMAQLPADQRQAVELRHIQELPIAEIGRLMGRSTPAVGGLLQRGMKALREWMDDSP
ncbi:MAG: sigma-70 family RNA polymerase sigma factor [Isosphaeraceae bacterium]